MSAVARIEVQGDEVLVTTHTCMMCDRPGQVRVPMNEYANWERGMLIQNAMPSLSPAERELLMSGTHGECWGKMFEE